MKTLSMFVCGLLLFLGCDGNDVAETKQDISLPWQTITPAQANYNVMLLNEAEAEASEIPRITSLLTVHKGKIVQEAYFQGASNVSLLDVRSVTKSMVSTIVGAMLQNNLLGDLDETLQEHMSEEVAILNDSNSDITIRDLLTMSGGFTWDETTSSSYNDWILSGDHLGYVLDQPITTPPGTAFTYNSAAVHLLGVLLDEASSYTLEALADSLLFQPLGITSVRWEAFPKGYVNGGAGIDLRPRDLARIGQLYLQNGRSGDQQILASSWVEEATTPRFGALTNNGPLQNITYGYLWWIVQDQPEPAYFAWGYGGQYIYIVPDLELVVVTTTNWAGLSQDEGGSDGLESAVMGIIINKVVAAIER